MAVFTVKVFDFVATSRFKGNLTKIADYNDCVVFHESDGTHRIFSVIGTEADCKHFAYDYYDDAKIADFMIVRNLTKQACDQ